MRTVRRPQRLREYLQSLAADTFRNFELVLVDMSGGLTSTIVEEMRECLPALRHLKLNGARSRPAALNRGIESAEGNVITILDDEIFGIPIIWETSSAISMMLILFTQMCASKPSLLPVK